MRSEAAPGATRPGGTCCTSTSASWSSSSSGFQKSGFHSRGGSYCPAERLLWAEERAAHRKDAFTGKEISQLSLAYEKASVIFNIGATLSSLAAQQNRSSPEGLKRAFHNFRCAAGMFTYINDNFLHAPSTDLSREVVKVLVTLMVAQATEVFVERLTEEKKGAGLRARVSTQAASLYGGIVEETKELVSKGVFDRSWTWLVQVCAICPR